ncbi:MAG TPA: zinc ribbon domain-containing protein [Gemmatimonadaceae bacterium]|nr:zinc ribbon domain-containing protein [Gemmatimonadaceae bacterium]
MPTYEFVCPDGHQFSRFYRKISDGVSELPCPECGQTATRKISGGAGLLFKGSGFYITDYGRKGDKNRTPARSGDSTSSNGGSGSSSDSASSTGATPSHPGSKTDAAASGGAGSAPAEQKNTGTPKDKRSSTA